MAEELYTEESESIEPAEQVEQSQEVKPKPKLSVKDFAAKVKAKYPDYQGIDDVTLVQKIVDKYPEYKEQIEFATPVVEKKKSSRNWSYTIFGYEICIKRVGR